MSNVVAITDATRERLAAGLYAKYRLRNPGTLTWETEPDSYKERFYAQADDAIDVVTSQGAADLAEKVTAPRAHTNLTMHWVKVRSYAPQSIATSAADLEDALLAGLPTAVAVEADCKWVAPETTDEPYAMQTPPPPKLEAPVRTRKRKVNRR